MSRLVLMIEVDGDDVEQRLADVLPDAVVWGEVDPVDAALLVCDMRLAAT